MEGMIEAVTTSNAAFQEGSHNILVQGNQNVVSLNQQGGITAHSVSITNISSSPKPLLKGEVIVSNKLENGK